MRILKGPLCTAALVLAAVACGDGTGPTLTYGDIFVLRSIASPSLTSSETSPRRASR
jgi:hypothetical protein